ncbi:MAG: ThiF family adenylyltransferase [Flavobacteriia bacterium]|nr:ThiF family adenylyltransferase [Flavobacteriia bacterium]
MSAGEITAEESRFISTPLIYPVTEAETLPEELSSESPTQIVDEYLAQVKEWIRIENPIKAFTPEELTEAAHESIDSKRIGLGNWVYYPWLDTVVRILEEPLFKQVRTSRNKHKITHQEQETLQSKVVGIVGLSVGQSAAVTLAMESIGGVLRLADFDTLDLSNLNRLRAGVHQLGLPKTVLAAREIAQIDPYIKIELYHEGIHDKNASEFLSGLDILVEECDSLPVKVMLRKFAQKMKLPVIMDTSDRGMVDVERFDKESDRAIFHGRLAPWEGKNPAEFTAEDRRNLLFALVDYEKTSERAKTSFAEIGKTINTWPQLASAVNLGGALMADTARRILLDGPVHSGRFYVDLEALIGGIDG